MCESHRKKDCEWNAPDGGAGQHDDNDSTDRSDSCLFGIC